MYAIEEQPKTPIYNQYLIYSCTSSILSPPRQAEASRNTPTCPRVHAKNYTT